MVENIADNRETIKANNRSQLRQWPIQLALVSPIAPFFGDAHLLIAADCAAYAYADFHEDYIKDKITLIGCTKLDDVDYAEKLTAILRDNNIKSVTVVRMELRCCCGIVNAVVQALQNSGKIIPWWTIILSPDGEVVSG
jgi:hypothetical protein